MKLASDDISKVIESFKTGPRFMQRPLSSRTTRLHELIAESPEAKDLINRGFSQDFAARVAKLNRESPSRVRDVPPEFQATTSMDLSGVSGDYMRGIKQGSGLIAHQAAVDPYSDAAYANPGGPAIGDMDVPADYLDLLNQRGRWNPSVLHPAGSMRGPLGRPTPEYLGVDPSIGGMPREENRNWAASNVLMQQALKGLPASFQELANTPIRRYATTEAYGPPTNRGGFYSGPEYSFATGAYSSGDVSVGRGNDIATFESVTGPMSAVDIARHELIHKYASEVQPFADDAREKFPGLQDALEKSTAALQAPIYGQLRGHLDMFSQTKDWGHVFTTLVEAAAGGLPLPPALKAYFAPMFRKSTGRGTRRQ
jgi:hypothetical protein